MIVLYITMVKICASQVAIILEHNRYASKYDTICMLYKEQYPEFYKTFSKHQNIKGTFRIEKKQKAIRTSLKATQSVADPRPICPVIVGNICTLFVKDESIGIDLQSTTLSLEDRPTFDLEPASEIDRIVSGIIYEPTIEASYEKEFKTKIHSQISKTLIGSSFTLVGRCDGIHGNRIVEFKNRNNRLMDRIPIYERDQLLAYACIFEKNDCVIYQRYGNRYSSLYISFSDKEKEEFLKSIEQWSTKFHAYMKH